MDHSDASGSSTFFLFLYLFFLMKDYGSIVIFPTFIVYFVSLVLSASPFSSKLVVLGKKDDFQKGSKFPHFVKLRPNSKTTIIQFDLSLLHVYGHTNNIYAEKCYLFRHSIAYNEPLPPP